MFSCLAALDTKVYRPFCILQARLPAGSGEIHRGCRATREASPQALYATPPSGEAACSLKRLAACRRPPQAACTLQAASAGGLLANSSFRRGCSQPRRLAACRRFRRASPARRRVWRVGRLNTLSRIAEFAFVEPAQPYGASVKLGSEKRLPGLIYGNSRTRV